MSNLDDHRPPSEPGAEHSLRRSWIIVAAVVIATLVWMLSGVLFQAQQDAMDDGNPAAQSIPSVRIVTSNAQPMTNQLVIQGRTLAARKVIVRAETSGVVEQVNVARGRTVEKGQLLVQLALEDRNARLVQARSQLKERQVAYAAARSLKQSGFQAETELARTKAALDAAEAALQLAELEMQRIAIKAPIAGMVNERPVELGSFVERGDPIATLVDLNPLRVVAQVSERYLGQIQPGVTGEARMVDGRVLPGQVSYLGSVASEATRTFPVELEIPNPDSAIIEGLTAELRLPVNEVRAHHMPASVLTLSDGGQLGVKAVDGEDIVRFYAAAVLGDNPGGIWLSGLPPTIKLITVGHEFVQAGQRVRAVPDAQTLPADQPEEAPSSASSPSQ